MLLHVDRHLLHDLGGTRGLLDLNIVHSPGLTFATPDHAISTAATKPIRSWFEVDDQDLFYPVASIADPMHDWVLSNENTARVLQAEGCHHQFVFARRATHVDWPTVAQTLPAALEWVWQGYSTP